jgi:two-component system sensor histidine kinase/response regulator
MDYRAYPILYVDDDPTNLQSMHYLLEDRFTLLTAATGEEALKIIAEQDVAVLIADMRMPGMSGAEVCTRAREMKPDVVRMIVTAYSDLHAAVDAINRGQISRYISKPYKKQELLDLLRNALDFVTIQRGVREMEVRLLRGNSQATAQAIYAELADEIETIGAELRGSVEQGSDLVRAAALSLGDKDRVVELLADAKRSQADAAEAISKLEKLGARVRAGQAPRSAPVRCDAARAVDAMVRILRTELERHGQVEVQIQGVPVVPMEASSLGHVVMNLLLNAAQAADPGSRGIHRMVVRVSVEGADALISISDNGVGIFPEDRERIFDPYFTTRTEGAGLGLAIARELVSAAGGTIDVFSEPKVGSTFTLRLPCLTS